MADVADVRLVRSFCIAFKAAGSAGGSAAAKLSPRVGRSETLAFPVLRRRAMWESQKKVLVCRIKGRGVRAEDPIWWSQGSAHPHSRLGGQTT